MLGAHVLITLASVFAWLCSTFVYLVFLRTSRRAVQLPLREDDDDDDLSRAYEDTLSHEEEQAFAFLTKNIDGEAVDQEGFSRRVRRSRLALIVCSLGCLALLSVQLFFQNDRPSPWRSWRGVLEDKTSWPLLSSVLLWSNTLYMALHEMQGPTHWTAIIQASTMNLFTALTCVTMLVVPNILRDDQISLYAVHLGIASLAIYITITIPSGPRRIKQTAKGTVPMARLSHKGQTVLSFLWFTNSLDLIRTARKKGTLDYLDVPQMGSDFDANRLNMQFQRHLSRSSQRKHFRDARRRAKGKSFSTLRSCWPIVRAVIGANRALFITNQILSALMGFAWYIPAYVSFRIVNFLEETERDKDNPPSGYTRLRFGFPFCLLFVSSILFTSLAMGQLLSLYMTWLRTRIRAQLQMAIFTKALRRKDVGAIEDFKVKDATASQGNEQSNDEESSEEAAESASFSKTQVINLVSVDTERISNVTYLMTFTMAPVEIGVGGFFAVYLLRWGAIVGLLASFALQPIIFFVGKVIARLQERLQETRDRKTSLLNEVVQAIRMVKFNAWEEKASARINNVRDEELRYQRYAYLTEAVQSFIFHFSPTFTVMIAYSWLALVEKKPMTPSVAFTALAVLDEMRFAMTYAPEAISLLIQSLVSLGRIQRYLESEDVSSPVSRHIQPPTLSDNVHLTNATITWPVIDKSLSSGSATPASTSAFALSNVTLRFQPNSLNLIVGRLGSGKTLLLLGLLGEADLLSGQISCPRSAPDSVFDTMTIKADAWMRSDQIAYVPQTAFLVNASLRDNILFGLPLLEERYQATIDACGLLPDLTLLDDGDETEIGENGIGLSGGQTIRVMLARAIYSRASTILLDDPLSAVDAHTAAHIHSKLLCGPLCAGRTVILVTHQVQLVAQSSAQIVMLKAGQVAYQGEPLPFMQSDMFSGLIEDQEQPADESGKQMKPDATLPPSTASSTAQSSLTTTPATTAPPSPRLDAKKSDGGDAPVEALKKSAKKLVEEEKRAKGAVLFSIYGRYVKAAGGWPTAIVLVSLFVIANSFQIVTKRWLQYWSDDVLRGLQDESQRQHTDQWWLIFWGLLWLVMLSLESLKMLVLIFASLRASRILFKDMLRGVLSATLRFHDTVSRGRLLNRFGYDFQEMDSEMADVFERVGDQGISLIVTLSAVATGGGLTFMLFFCMLIPLYLIIGQLYLTAVRDLKRLASVTRSPILNLFGDVVRGAAVMRAFGTSAQCTQTLVERVNENTSYNVWQNDLRWWYEQLFNTISFFVMMAAVVLVLLNPGINSSKAGFIFTFLINLHVQLLFLLQSITNMEQKLVSVERIVEYCSLPAEETQDLTSVAVAQAFPAVGPEWPAQGEVKVNDLHVRYAKDLPEVLKGVTFSLRPGAKVGVVGPTGCGKSTLASAFFRFVELTRGSIVIDGVNVEQVDLRTLRSRLQIVPQDPIIFSGPVRASIDVFDEYTDKEVLEALRTVQLYKEDEQENGGVEDGGGERTGAGKTHNFHDLNFMVSEGGANLSGGEKQLICLARAILRQCKLIIFDEATSSVDFDTDATISRVIKDAFSQSTIITIAHRLRTIIEYDYILVLDKGSVVEFASPGELLRDPQSRFYKLCRATGRRELAFLRKAAGIEREA